MFLCRIGTTSFLQLKAFDKWPMEEVWEEGLPVWLGSSEFHQNASLADQSLLQNNEQIFIKYDGKLG